MTLEERITTALQRAQELTRYGTPEQVAAILAIHNLARSSWSNDDIIEGLRSILGQIGYSVEYTERLMDQPPGNPLVLNESGTLIYHLCPKTPLNGHTCIGTVSVIPKESVSPSETLFIKHMGDTLAEILDHALLYDHLDESIRFLEMVSSVVGHDLKSPIMVISGRSSFGMKDVRELHKAIEQGDSERVSVLVSSIATHFTKNVQTAKVIESAVGLFGAKGWNYDQAHERLSHQRIVPYMRKIFGTFEDILRDRREGFLMFTDGITHRTAFDIDPRYLNGILLNLMGNAIKYAIPGTDIYTVVRNTHEALVIEFENPVPEVIPADALGNLCNKGFRLSVNSAPEGHGINQGLGLYFVNLGVTQGYRGTIDLKSAEEALLVRPPVPARISYSPQKAHPGPVFSSSIAIPWDSLKRKK